MRQSLMRCGRRCSGTLIFSILVFGLFCLLAGRPAQSRPSRPPKLAPFFLHDRDTVVFYGDSITDQNRYTRDIETFVVSEHPRWHTRFLNAGWIGDTVEGGKGGPIDVRLARDVLPYRPTVVTILLGTNDAGYGPFDPARLDTYGQGLGRIVDALREKLPGVRIVLLTPPFYDEDARQSHHIADYNATLRRYGDRMKLVAAQKHLPVIDLNAPLQAATETGRKADPEFTLALDGVHPTEAGHRVIAATILHAWAAPPPRPNAQAAQTQALIQKRLELWRAGWKAGPDAIVTREALPLKAQIRELLALDRSLDVWRIQARRAAMPPHRKNKPRSQKS